MAVSGHQGSTCWNRYSTRSEPCPSTCAAFAFGPSRQPTTGSNEAWASSFHRQPLLGLSHLPERASNAEHSDAEPPVAPMVPTWCAGRSKMRPRHRHSGAASWAAASLPNHIGISARLCRAPKTSVDGHLTGCRRPRIRRWPIACACTSPTAPVCTRPGGMCAECAHQEGRAACHLLRSCRRAYAPLRLPGTPEIGRASCRERG